jgi:hypothetical protein
MCVSSIGNLMHRLRFTPRVAHVQRRYEVGLDAEAAFQAEVAQILCDPGFDRSSVINMDETAIRLHGGRNVTWAKVGADGVWIGSPSNPKDCFTVVAACTADGQKLPLTFVAKGKTVRCHEGFGDVGEHWIAHTESGWMIEELLIKLLGRIHPFPKFAAKSDLIVMLDQAP